MPFKMPRFIEPDKANHRVRGGEIAGVFGSVAVALAALMLPLDWALGAGAVAAPASAAAAGWAVERWQVRQNEISLAHGGVALHTIERADIVATLRGSWPVALALAVAAIVAAMT